MAKRTTTLASAILAVAAISTSSAHVTFGVSFRQPGSDIVATGTGTIDRGGVAFSATTLGGTLLYTGGPTLDTSSSLDLDDALLIVTNISAGDQSGLSLFPDGPDSTVTLTSPINYGSGSGTLDASIIGGGHIFETWTGVGGDLFTETLSEVLSIGRATSDEITVSFSGTLSDLDGLFVDRPAKLILSADQSGGPGAAVGASITNTASNVPEPSTWAMMLFGFAGLGFVGWRGYRRTARHVT
jgi:PEP-CTERM motif